MDESIHKRKPPVVPPKPSKSKKSNGLGIVNRNQSFMTADVPLGSGDNSEGLESLILGSKSEDQEHKIPVDELGDRTQKVSLSEQMDVKEAESIVVSNPVPVEAKVINQPSLGSASTACPFYKLHHQTPCEFLSFPQIADEDKPLLLEIDDLSSNVDHKLKFIVDNLKNCGGIWPKMFIEKFNRIIVRADFQAVQNCFQEDDFLMMHKLVELHSEEKRCHLVFRYWCTFYNVLCRNLVPFPVLAQSGLLELLRRDFLRASKGDETSCSCSTPDDEEHSTMTSKMQMEIISILLIPLFTAQTNLTQIQDFAKEKEFSTLVLEIIDGTKSTSSSKLTDPDPDKETGKCILLACLLAYNLQFPSNSRENPLVEAILSSDCNHSIFKRKLMTIFLQEYNLLMQGCLTGIGSLIPSKAPLGFQIVGVNGPMKLLSDILTVDGCIFFDADDLRFMLNLVLGIQSALAEDGYSDDKTEEIRSNSVDLQKLVEFKLGNFVSPDEVDENVNSSRSVVNSSTLTVSSNKSSATGTSNKSSVTGTSTKSTKAEKRSKKKSQVITTESETDFESNNSGHPKGRVLKTMMVMWPVEVVLKCFGCSKRKATVVPATEDDEEFAS